MRKDFFIVGARLLAIWLLIEALNSLTYVIGSWLGHFYRSSFSYEYSLINLIIHLIAGFYLLFKTNELFNFLERGLTKAEDTEEENNIA